MGYAVSVSNGVNFTLFYSNSTKRSLQSEVAHYSGVRVLAPNWDEVCLPSQKTNREKQMNMQHITINWVSLLSTRNTQE